jgi:hypothetical protein
MHATGRRDRIDRPLHGLARQRDDRDVTKPRGQQTRGQRDREAGRDEAVDRRRIVGEISESRFETGRAAGIDDQSVARRGEPRVGGELGEPDALPAGQAMVM